MALAVTATALVPSVAAPAAAASGCLPAGGGTVAAAPAPPADVIVEGHGWGHGLGMSQYGARGAAELGCDADTILSTYYPGLHTASTALASRVLVDMLSGGRDGARALVGAEDGSVTWRANGSAVVQPAGATWRVERAGSRVVVRSGATTTSPVVSTLTTTAGGTISATHGGTLRLRTYLPSGALNLDRRSKDAVTRVALPSSGLQVREVIADNSRGSGVQRYLEALGELPLSWPVVTHEAQTIAARTYLMGKYVAAEGGYVILPTPAHQVWAGATQQEQDARYGGHLAAAVARTTSGTRGVVLTTSSGAVARDVLYSSSHGGYSESNSFVWGGRQSDHLRPVDDSRWDAVSGNPYRSWSVGLSLAQVAKAFGMSSVTSIDVAERGSPQRTAVRVRGVRAGTAGTFSFTGWDARQRLMTVAPQVRSTGLTFRRGQDGQALVGDWDGDGRDEAGWYSNGRVVLSTGSGPVSYTFGGPGHTAVVGDFDGDGRDSVGTFAGGRWSLRNARSTGPADVTFAYGRRGDRPVVGAWTGSRDGIGVVRGNQWFLRTSPTRGNSNVVFRFARATDTVLVGDWDGDGRDTPAAVRGNRRYLAVGTPPASVLRPFRYGRASDAHLTGDWDGDGRDTPAVARDTQLFRANGPTGGSRAATVALPW